MLSVADWSIILFYLLGMIALGLWSARGHRSKRDYFLGGRRLPWWTVGLSIVATETSALTFIGVPALAIGALRITAGGAITTDGGNLLFIQLVIGYVIARFIVAAVFVPHYFRGDVYTPYQLLTRAFGPPPRYLAAGISLCSMSLQAGFRVYVSAIPVTIVLRTLYPEWQIWWSIALFTAAALVYTAVGGITAVVWTDVAQFFVFFLGGLFALLYIPTLLQGDLAAPSGATGWAALAEVGKDKLAFWNWGIAGRAAGQGWWAWLGACAARILGGDFNIWMGLVGATVGVMVSHGADQLNVQRVLACRDEAGGRRALVLSAVVIAPQFLVFLLVGVGLFAFYTLNGFDFGGIDPWDPTLSDPRPKADYIFPIFIVTQLPAGVRGFLAAGLIAAAMSSLTSALTAISSVAVMDLWRPLRRISGEGAPELWLGRAGTALAGAALVGVAWWAKDAPLIFNMVFQFAGVFSGAKLGALLFAVRARSGRPAPVMVGMLASCLVMAAVAVGARAGLVLINWPWYSLIGTAICYGATRALSGGGPGSGSGHGGRSIDRPANEEI